MLQIQFDLSETITKAGLRRRRQLSCAYDRVVFSETIIYQFYHKLLFFLREVRGL